MEGITKKLLVEESWTSHPIPYMRKYHKKADRSSYNPIDYYRYVAINYLQIPTYKRTGGKKNPEYSHAAVDCMDLFGTHGFLIPFILTASVALQCYDITNKIINRKTSQNVKT